MKKLKELRKSERFTVVPVEFDGLVVEEEPEGGCLFCFELVVDPGLIVGPGGAAQGGLFGLAGTALGMVGAVFVELERSGSEW